jgi:hypothetical protein
MPGPLLAPRHVAVVSGSGGVRLASPVSLAKGEEVPEELEGAGLLFRRVASSNSLEGGGEGGPEGGRLSRRTSASAASSVGPSPVRGTGAGADGPRAGGRGLTGGAVYSSAEGGGEGDLPGSVHESRAPSTASARSLSQRSPVFPSRRSLGQGEAV